MKTKIFRLTPREEGAVRSPLQFINDRLACRIHFHPPLIYNGFQSSSTIYNSKSTFTFETISSYRECGHILLLRGQSHAGKSSKPVESIFTLSHMGSTRLFIMVSPNHFLLILLRQFHISENVDIIYRFTLYTPFKKLAF